MSSEMMWIRVIGTTIVLVVLVFLIALFEKGDDDEESN